MSARPSKWRPPGQNWITPLNLTTVFLRDLGDGFTTVIYLRVDLELSRWCGGTDDRTWDGRDWSQHLSTKEAWNLLVPEPAINLTRRFARDARRTLAWAAKLPGASVVDRRPMGQVALLHTGRLKT